MAQAGSRYRIVAVQTTELGRAGSCCRIVAVQTIGLGQAGSCCYIVALQTTETGQAGSCCYIVAVQKPFESGTAGWESSSSSTCTEESVSSLVQARPHQAAHVVEAAHQCSLLNGARDSGGSRLRLGDFSGLGLFE